MVETTGWFWHALSGETLNNHVFPVTVDDPESLFIQVYCGATQKKLSLEKAREDIDQLVGIQLTVMPMPGIWDIKSVELYDKFQMLIPVEYHKDWLYFATPPPIETCRKVKN